MGHYLYMQGEYVMSTGLHKPGDNVMSKKGYELQRNFGYVNHLLGALACSLLNQRETVDVLAEISHAVRTVVSEYLS